MQQPSNFYIFTKWLYYSTCSFVPNNIEEVTRQYYRLTITSTQDSRYYDTIHGIWDIF